MRPMHVAYRASVYTIPMKILTGTIKAFPKAKIYILNSSMDQLESIHSNICKEL